MPTDEAARHEMLVAVEATIGKEATTMADHLPPAGWADVARRSDLDHLEGSLRTQIGTGRHQTDRVFGEVQHDLSRTRDDIARSQRTVVRTVVGALVASVSANAALTFTAMQSIGP